MGIDKLSLPWKGGTILEHCARVLLRSNIEGLVIVLSFKNREFKNLFRSKKVKIVINPRPDKGMSGSLKKGLRAIPSKIDGFLVALGDQPLLHTRTINALIRVFEKGERGIVVPSFSGKRGHPVIFHQRYRKELSRLKGDIGGRSLLERHPGEVQVVPVKSKGVVTDIDTWQDYREAKRITNGD